MADNHNPTSGSSLYFYFTRSTFVFFIEMSNMASRLFLSSYCMFVFESAFTDDLIDLLLHDSSFAL